MGLEKQLLSPTVVYMGQCPKIHLKPRVLGINFIPETRVLDLEKLVLRDTKKHLQSQKILSYNQL